MMNDPIMDIAREAAKRDGTLLSHADAKAIWLQRQQAEYQQEAIDTGIRTLLQAQSIQTGQDQRQFNAEFRRSNPQPTLTRPYKMNRIARVLDEALEFDKITHAEYLRMTGIAAWEFERTDRQLEEIQAIGSKLSRAGYVL
jgi:hypothetical protein